MSVIKADVNLEASFDQPTLTLPGTAVIAAIGVEFSTELIFGQPCVKSRNGSMAIVGCYTDAYSDYRALNIRGSIEGIKQKNAPLRARSSPKTYKIV